MSKNSNIIVKRRLTEHKFFKLAKDGAIIILTAFLSAIGTYYFIVGNNFIPMGIEGIAVMLQAVTGMNIGILSLILNLPLLAIAWFVINRKYVVYSVAFILISSLLLILLPYTDFQLNTADKNVLLDAIFAGILLGLRTGLMLHIGGSSGGLDIIASMIHKKQPYMNIEKILFVLNVGIIVASFFVYDYIIYSVLLSIFFSFVFSYIINVVLQGPKNALEFKIITEDSDKIAQAIINELKHGVTIIKAKGGYTDGDKCCMLCVVNKRDIADFRSIIKRQDKTFAYISEVNEVIGNFRRGKNELPK